ncbi:MAG: hypothetical protein GF355_13005 [Candidatus Eisenbacteria bacterium]|nr:hypothetical protein [Candidatus Eisenbacteria bacterium]
MKTVNVNRFWVGVLFVFTLSFMVLGCSDDDNPVDSTPPSEYEISFALWMFDPPEISIVGGVLRQDPDAPPATSCGIWLNGSTEVPLTSWSNADTAYYSLELPELDPGATYSMEAMMGARSAAAAIVAPEGFGSIDVLQPADSAGFSPGEELLVVWDYTGPPHGETEVGFVVGCGESHFEYRQLVGGNDQSYTIPSAVTEQAASCDGDAYIEVIARDSGMVEGDLATSASRWFLIIDSDITQIVDTKGSGVVAP